MPERLGSRLLIVEDDPASARLMERVLAQHRFDRVSVVATTAEALRFAGDADIILLDYELPDATGLDVLAALREQPGRPSVIMVTAHGNESIAASALRLGADDYLVKDATLPTMLPEVVERVRRHRALSDALAVAERELVRAERLAAIGEMTVTLHHEINNPLMAATATVDLLLHPGTNLTTDQREALEDAARALERIRLIVRRVGSLQDAPSREYVGGMRMVDLDAGGQPQEQPPVRRGAAAVWTRGEELGRVTAMLLRQQGFTVERCASVGELELRARRIGMSLLVVEAGDPSAGDPLGGFVPAPDRAYHLVVLTPDPARLAGLAADLVLPVPIDPATFGTEVVAACR